MRNHCFINFVFAVILIELSNAISKTTKTGHSGGTPNSSWGNFLEKLFVIDKPLGAELIYINDENLKCYVVDDRRVKYQEETMYMTTLAKLLTGKKSIAGSGYFKYNGKNLQYYYEIYQSKNN